MNNKYARYYNIKEEDRFGALSSAFKKEYNKGEKISLIDFEDYRELMSNYDDIMRYVHDQRAEFIHRISQEYHDEIVNNEEKLKEYRETIRQIYKEEIIGKYNIAKNNMDKAMECIEEYEKNYNEKIIER